MVMPMPDGDPKDLVRRSYDQISRAYRGDSVRLTPQEFPLLRQIEVTTWRPSSFVTGAEDFDDGHHTALVPCRQDLNESLAHFHWIKCQDLRRVTDRSS